MQLFQPLSILEQKFRIAEQRVKLTERKDLLERLSSNRHMALTTIISPAGFGKSTLMAQHIKSLNQAEENKTVWIALDASDNEANQFFSLLCHALVFINIADKSLLARANNSSAKADFVSFSQEILNVIQKSQHQIYLLFDDFHFISDPIIAAFIDRLLYYCPKHLHLIITSRVLPSFELSPLYAQGLLFNLSAEELKFSLAETQHLLSEFVSEKQLALLHRQTEGWPVALQLLRLWYQQNPHTDPTRVLTNNIDTLTSYMKEQVFEKFDLATQNFLLKTSFLDRFDIELANYVCEIDNGATIIAGINEQQSLIISLDQEHTSFRYHHLFSDFLQQTFVMTVGESQCNELRSKAALWFAEKTHLNEAISQCVRAKNIQLAKQLLTKAGGWQMILTKGIGYVESLLSHFSKKDITESPTLGLLQCYFYLKLGQVVAAEEQYQVAELIHQDLIASGYESDASTRDFVVMRFIVKIYLDQILETNQLQAINNAIKTFALNDHLGRGTLLAFEALLYNQYAQFELAEQTAVNCSREMQLANCWVGVNYITLHHGQSKAYRGHLESALSLFDHARKLAEEHLGMDSGLQSMAMCLTANIYYQMGQLDKAKALLEHSIIALELRDCWYDIYAVTFKLAINLALADNDEATCYDYLARGEKTARSRKLWRLEMLLDVLAQKVAFHFNHKDLFATLNNKIIREKYWSEELHLWQVKGEYHTLQAIYFLQNNVANKAMFHTEKLLKICTNSKQMIDIAKAKIIQAIAYSSLDSNPKAFNILLDVCQDCAKYKIKQVFYEVPASIEYLLIKFKKHSGHLLSKLALDFINDVINGFKKNSHSDFAKFGLSHREQQLIPLLTQGKSNKQISANLGISENTVKFHLKNLFAKINVSNRNKASIFFISNGYDL
ncbi:transcriptional regulator /transcriptional regulator, LuxR family [Colwellia chukchiensis]|uniref:Transcriptional regulator /transcriptional regulator, LuxR family n=1 Tax=Colwellia chukchiensis TaxID=641665 RepID=A0A1H7PE05_9GAMM|nr:LuxR C-terminal-related transcriptional regulator [Colwellia chukchiensis]SEL33515.1 transcriptional regulator /transcriptional regulator, LuxR family [Colwellia chukchiensis]